MGMSGTRKVGPLECPDCGGKILWDGVQHVCLGCPWKEHVARPPSERKLPLPKKKPDENR